ncbi:leucine-rich repeat domain-containing protein, partial [Brachyspira hampsonii]
MENIDKKIEDKLNSIYDFLKKNNINKYINYSRKKLLNIKKLDLSSLKLNYIPKEINILTNLETLDICNNLIEEIPESISELVNLKYIDASFNK